MAQFCPKLRTNRLHCNTDERHLRSFCRRGAAGAGAGSTMIEVTRTYRIMKKNSCFTDTRRSVLRLMASTRMSRIYLVPHCKSTLVKLVGHVERLRDGYRSLTETRQKTRPMLITEICITGL